MASLSVNINKVATIRNARGGHIPDVVQVAIDCESFGAQGITVHPRPDERHITYKDVFDLKPVIKTEFNIEGYPSERFIKLVNEVQPHQVTLVPDPPEAITSDSGWDTFAHLEFLRTVIASFQENGIRTSIFIDTNGDNIKNAAKTGTDRVELYTEPYASEYEIDPDKAVQKFVEASVIAHRAGLGVNAGHDLSLENLGYFSRRVPYLDEVSIGHALISDALYLGFKETIKRYKSLLV